MLKVHKVNLKGCVMYEVVKYLSLPIDIDFQSITYRIKLKIEALMEEIYTKNQVRKLLNKALHEMKTSFVSVMSNATVLQDILSNEKELESEEVMSKVIQFIQSTSSLGRQNADIILKLVESAGGMQIEKERLSLKECLEQALLEYNFEHNSRDNVSFSLEKDFEFIGDGEGFKYVIFNLLRNSFMHNGFNVKISITSKGNKLIYQDNGIGISKENLAKIFENHYTTNEKGLGLGLPFCRNMFEAMGSKIECESEEGSYTKFIITLSTLLEGEK